MHLSQNTHGETRQAWYAAEMYQKRCDNQIRLREHDTIAISGQWFDIAGHQDSKHSF